jgi:hypothetical protein
MAVEQYGHSLIDIYSYMGSLKISVIDTDVAFFDTLWSCALF